MKGNKKAYNKSIILIMVFLLFVFVVGIITPITVARYFSKGNTDDGSTVAKFIDLNSNDVLQETVVSDVYFTPEYTEKVTKEIAVKNNGETNVICTLKVHSTNNLPLNYSWNIKGNDVITNDTTYDSLVSIGSTVTYVLSITWDTSVDDYFTSYEFEYIYITVECEQYVTE